MQKRQRFGHERSNIKGEPERAKIFHSVGINRFYPVGLASVLFLGMGLVVAGQTIDPPDPEDEFLYIRPIGGVEWTAHPTYFYSAPTTPVNSHVVQIQFLVTETPKDRNPILELISPGLSATPGGGGPGTPPTTHRVFIVHGAGVGFMENREPYLFPGDVNLASGIGYKVVPGDIIPVHVSAGGTGLRSFKVSYGHETESGVVGVTETYDLYKTSLFDSSIDTRREFGQPNAEGEYPAADPNAPLANIDFSAWMYKGGLFAGFAPPLPVDNPDRSGIGRLQLYADENENPRTLSEGRYSLTILSLFYTGKPQREWVENGLFSVYCPRSDDPEIETEESEMRWSTRWDINPRPDSDRTDPPLFHRDSFRRKGFKLALPMEEIDWPVNEYWTVGLTDVFDEEVGSSYITRFESPFGRFFAVTNWSTFTEPEVGEHNWRYFASREFSVDRSARGFPFTEAYPRVWTLFRTDVEGLLIELE